MTPKEYHDGTKHHFHRFAPSLGYLDWASQPAPFRSFTDAPLFPLYPGPGGAAGGYTPHPVTYDRLFRERAGEPRDGAVPLSAAAIGDVLRHALGLSAWKQFRESRWSLRVNPSSGNLHPTEAYVVAGPVPGLAPTAALYHYAADRHALEQRCAFESAAWSSACADPSRVWLLALTSIHWREAWKYGERAFRYCQHDLGHAIGAVRLAAALAGWNGVMLADWSQANIARLTGIDRDQDYVEAEREEPGCLLAIISPQSTVIGPQFPVDSQQSSVDSRQSSVLSSGSRLETGDWGLTTRPKVDGLETGDWGLTTPPLLVEAVCGGGWSGRASQLSVDHVDWQFIDDIARGTQDPGRTVAAHRSLVLPAVGSHEAGGIDPRRERLGAREVIIGRRSAVALDGQSSVHRSAFIHMIGRVIPDAGAPWDALWWTPRIHLVLFVHRVDGLDPGVYVLPRDRPVVDRMKAAFGREFLWENADDRIPLIRLTRGDCRRVSQRLSCDQEIAADGFFSLAMLADFDASLQEHGPSFYRHLFWESGVVGQVLYLEAEAAGARATGIGCFYDDAVHDVLGLTGHAFQSLYHFTVGMPVDDARLMTEPGYRWERS